MDHVVIDGLWASYLQNVRALPELLISTHENLVSGKVPGHRAVIAAPCRGLRKSEAKLGPLV